MLRKNKVKIGDDDDDDHDVHVVQRNCPHTLLYIYTHSW